MRVDKYLQVSRMVKRRTVAQQLCDGGHVQVNDRRAKSGTTVAPGDVIDVNLGPRRMRVRVLRLPRSFKETETEGAFEILQQVRNLDW